MNKKLAHVLWAWGSTIAFAGLIYWIATIPNFDVNSDVTNEVIKVVFRMLLYAILFTLFFRSIIATLKNTVKRLSAWRSRREAEEDAEFMLIIETMAIIVSVLSSVIFAVFEENVQRYIPGRNALAGEAERDVLVSTMAVLLAAIVVYSVPAIGELEVAIMHKLRKEVSHYKGKKEQAE
jgi:hypothetical protein